jgi:soluble lytic murein transglycosylase
LLAEKHIQKDGFAYAQAEWITGWLALRCMKKPTEGYERFVTLYHKVKTPISKARAAYWVGRAAQDMKQQDLAKSWYKKASTYQTVYYGQLARQKLALAERLPKASVPSLSSYDLGAYKKNEIVQAAQLFHKAGVRTTASAFIQAFVRAENSPKAYRYGAELAAKMGHYHDAVRIAKDATKKGLFLTAQAFPTLEKVSRHTGLVERALVHALVRQESMFDYEAKSPAGARGLMQLMPATARETAKKQNVSYKKAWLTQKPAYNVRLGTAYMRQMLDRYDDSYPLAVAAYNAGPGRVDRWIANFGDPRKGEVGILDWIELIPVYETRNYVQRVMENLYVYRIILKGKNKRHQSQ